MGLKGWSGQVWKILLHPGFIPQTFHPVVSRNAEYSILAHSLPRHSVSNRRLVLSVMCLLCSTETGIRDESSVSFVPLYDSEICGVPKLAS